jgi:hypothetical protein
VPRRDWRRLGEATARGFALTCRNNVQKCEGTKISKNVILVTRIRNIDTEINVRTVGCKNKE